MDNDSLDTFAAGFSFLIEQGLVARVASERGAAADAGEQRVFVGDMGVFAPDNSVPEHVATQLVSLLDGETIVDFFTTTNVNHAGEQEGHVVLLARTQTRLMDIFLCAGGQGNLAHGVREYVFADVVPLSQVAAIYSENRIFSVVETPARDQEVGGIVRLFIPSEVEAAAAFFNRVAAFCNVPVIALQPRSG